MVDPNLLLASWIRSANLPQLPKRGTTGSVYGVDLPDDINIPVDGPAIVVAGRGGKSQTEITSIICQRMQISIWADIFRNDVARAVYGAMSDFIDGKGNVTIAGVGYVMSCYEVTPPQDMSDPDTGFARVVAFYEMFARS